MLQNRFNSAMALREKNTNPSSSREKAPTIADAALLGFISSLGPFAVNANVPGFHAIAADMGVSFIAVQLSLTVYLATYAVASLFVGAVSDSLGRKPVIIAGMLLFMVASLGADLATTIEVFYFWRFVQGLTAAAGQVVTQAVVRDRWAGLGAARMNALIAMFFAVSPALAPVVGGALIVRFSWHAVFVFLIVYAGLIALFTARFIPETLPAAKRRAFGLMQLLTDYRRGFTNTAFMAGVAAHGCCFMGGILYSAGAADFVIRIMHLGVDDFAYLTFPLIGTSLVGSWYAARWAQAFGPVRMLYATIGFMIAAGAASTLADYSLGWGFPLILIGPMLYQFGMALCRPVMMAMNLDYFPDNRGMAASIQQFFVTAGFSVSTALWVPLVMGSAWKYSAVMSFSAVLVLALWMISMRKRKSALRETGLREPMA